MITPATRSLIRAGLVPLKYTYLPELIHSPRGMLIGDALLGEVGAVRGGLFDSSAGVGGAVAAGAFAGKAFDKALALTAVLLLCIQLLL